jgi:hypothetical protein
VSRAKIQPVWQIFRGSFASSLREFPPPRPPLFDPAAKGTRAPPSAEVAMERRHAAGARTIRRLYGGLGKLSSTAVRGPRGRRHHHIPFCEAPLYHSARPIEPMIPWKCFLPVPRCMAEDPPSARPTAGRVQEGRSDGPAAPSPQYALDLPSAPQPAGPLPRPPERSDRKRSMHEDTALCRHLPDDHMRRRAGPSRVVEGAL